MLNTIVVDDEFHAVERVKGLVEKVKELDLVGGYTEADNCLYDIKEEKVKPDVIFLDIEMPTVNGLELAHQILEVNEEIDIIFITAYKNYAIEAFELNVLDYLLKPITEKRFEKSISRLLAKREEIISSKDEDLQIFTLGNFNICYQGQDLDLNWSTAKTKELFLYLLHYRGDFIACDKIVEALWPFKNQDKAVNILYTTIYSLRKMLEKVGFKNIIISKRGFYCLDLEQVSWDVIEFERIAGEIKENSDKNIKKVDRLIELYQGEYLTDKSYKWAHALRAELKEELKIILLKAADYYETEGKSEEATRLLKKIIGETFLAEEAYKRIIQIYQRQENEMAARRWYKKFKDRMKGEFGIEPRDDFLE